MLEKDTRQEPFSLLYLLVWVPFRLFQLEEIERVMDRDFFMDPQQAKDFGVIDQILGKRTKDEIDLLETKEDED